jgi:Transglutaminase-like superfamily
MGLVSQRLGSDATPASRDPVGRIRLRRTRLALEILGLYARIRWLVLRHGAVSVVPMLRRGLTPKTPVDAQAAQLRQGVDLGRAVQKVLRALPLDGRCLMRSLVLTGVLARRGIYGSLVIGVRSEPTFAAHAWVELQGRPLLPTDESVYSRLVEI